MCTIMLVVISQLFMQKSCKLSHQFSVNESQDTETPSMYQVQLVISGGLQRTICHSPKYSSVAAASSY